MNTSPGQAQPVVPQTPAQALMLMRIVWGSLLVSQLMYAYVGVTILKPGTPPVLDGALNSELTTVTEPTLMQGFQDPQGQVMTLIAIAALVMSFVLPKLIMRSPTKTMTVGPASTPVRMKFVQFVVGCALNEVVAIIGLIAGLIILNNPAFGSMFIYVSAAAMLLRFPTEESLRGPTSGPSTGRMDSRSV